MDRSWLRRAQRPLSRMLAGLAACVAAASFPAMAQELSPAEKVAALLGTNLPLLPGERIVPTASEDCSVIAFAPDEVRYNRFVNYWKSATWVGACRFGLAHGVGYAAGVNGGWATELKMIYGLQVVAPATWEDFNYLDSSGTYRRKFSNFLAGNAYSELSAVRYTFKGFDSWGRAASMAEVVGDWMTDSYLQKTSFDADGSERVVTLVQVNVAAHCDTVKEPYKAFASEVKKACKTKPDDKQLLIRREGVSRDPTDNHPIVWAKACPVPKGNSWAECDGLLSEALGKDWADMERTVAGDAAARAAAEREILARFAPLEAAVDARARTAGRGGQ